MSARIPENSGGPEFFDNVTRVLEAFSRFDNCPENLRNLFFPEREIYAVGRKIRFQRRPAIFSSHVIQESKDVAFVERTSVEKQKWLFDVITVKASGLCEFKNVLQCIPTLKERLKTVKEKQQFSQRYVLRPYSLAVELWLRDDNSSITVLKDLKSFLEGATRYFSLAEWRTSIVLSAITVESMLADLYEEAFKEPAPDTPLGDLFHKVKESMSFPSEIVRAIEMTNESRIAAVHRSRFPVSDREATNALFGATNFALWYSSQF